MKTDVMDSTKAWQAVRMDLKSCMDANKDRLPDDLVESARELWRAGYSCHPSKGMMAEWYIQLVSDFITDCENEIKKPKTLKRAA